MIFNFVLARFGFNWFLARFGRLPNNSVELSWAWNWFLD